MSHSITSKALLLIAAAMFGLPGCSDPVDPPPLLPGVTVTVAADPASDDQTGVVGTALSQPLRVTVDSEGVPVSGVTVRWEASDGSIAPASSLTDANGVAAAAWTLATVAGKKQASAKVPGAHGSPVGFSATALPGPASRFHKLDGDGQTRAANHGRFSDLIVDVTDHYGNVISGQAVDWTIDSGPVALVTTSGATNAAGRSGAVVAPTGASGSALVRAALPGGGESVAFALTVVPPEWDVTLNTILGAFVSAQNGSNPAVDTIPAGETVTWTDEPFDYDAPSPVSVGTPSFHGAQNLPYVFQVTFTAPGTYHYADSYYPQATGIVVVQ